MSTSPGGDGTCRGDASHRDWNANGVLAEPLTLAPKVGFVGEIRKKCMVCMTIVIQGATRIWMDTVLLCGDKLCNRPCAIWTVLSP